MNPSEKIEFAGHDGSLLAARFERAVRTPRACAIFAHCFTCGKESIAAARIARELAMHGYGVLRFDFTGLGGSGGDFVNTGFSSNVEDLIAAADWLREHHEAPSLLVGHSLGGAAVLAAAHSLSPIRAVATIAAPAHPSHIKGLLDNKIEEIRSQGEAEVTLGGRSFRISSKFLEDLENFGQENRLESLKCAKLLFHSPQDTVVSIDEARKIYEMLKHPKSFVSLENADHLLTSESDATYVASVLAAWAGRYLPEAEPTQEGPQEVWVEDLGSGFTQRVRARRHEFLADEPEDYGGKDLGPTPYDFLLTALGTCTSMTLRMYARKKGLSLERVVVGLNHDRVHGEDCEQCDEQVKKLDRIRRVVYIEGDLDAEQRQRLMEIADRCPVHKTLTGEIRIETEEGGLNPG